LLSSKKIGITGGFFDNEAYSEGDSSGRRKSSERKILVYILFLKPKF
jgi:hypothetical protein